MNMQLILHSYRTTGRMDLSNCNIDDMKTCNNDNIVMKNFYAISDSEPLVQVYNKIILVSIRCLNL